MDKTITSNEEITKEYIAELKRNLKNEISSVNLNEENNFKGYDKAQEIYKKFFQIKQSYIKILEKDLDNLNKIADTFNDIDKKL